MEEEAMRLRELLDALHWGHRVLAAVLGVHERLPARWISDERPIPEPVMPWLERIAAPILKEPLPPGWDKGEKD